MTLAAVLLAAALRAGAAGPDVALQEIRVKPGDTLWGIAQTYLKDPSRWDEILRHNELPTRDPTVALPGLTLKVPVALVKEELRSAVLARLRNQVLHRPRGRPDWASARLSMDLFPQDGLRTLDGAEATVRFSGGESLVLTENSMVLLNPPKPGTDLELVRGEVRAGRAKVLTSGALVTPRGADADYSARVREDHSTLVKVFKGKAEVEAQGRRVEISAGFGAEVELGLPPSEPIPLPRLEALESARAEPPRPQPVLQGDLLRVALPPATATPPPAALPPSSGAVQPVALGSPIQGWRLQVARDPDFKDLVLEKAYNAMDPVDFSRLKLPAGELWWRVAYVDLLGSLGRWSEPRAWSQEKPRPPGR